MNFYKILNKFTIYVEKLDKHDIIIIKSIGVKVQQKQACKKLFKTNCV